jgi:predicted ATPase
MDDSDTLIDPNKRIYKFVITGGPCAGKTTAMERMQVYLRERGFRVFVVPEAATMLFLNGAYPQDLASVDCERAFQSFVIKTQLTLEDSFQNYARACGKKSVLLCDRGVMDGSAYVTDEIWTGVLQKVGLDHISARDTRYDAIFHLVTAADGAETFYSLANNEARHETPEQAIAQDRKTQHAWNGHPHHIIIDNRKQRPFERKMELLVSMLSGYVGLPSLTRRSYKYSLNSIPDLSQITGLQEFEVEKIMLEEGVGAVSSGLTRSRARSRGESLGSPPRNFQNKSSTSPSGETSTTVSALDSEDMITTSEDEFQVLYSFIRRRSQGSFHAHGLTTVKQLPSGEKVELKQVISGRMYNILASSADPNHHIVRQKRYCFQYERQSFHIYEYIEPVAGIWTVLCQAEAEPTIPDFLDVGPELSSSGDGSMFSTREISLLASRRAKDAPSPRPIVSTTMPKPPPSENEY